MSRTKDIILILLIIVLTMSLVFVSGWTNGIIIFEGLSEAINKQILYQSITLLGAIILVTVLRVTKKQTFQRYFSKGDISAEILPEPLIGLKPKPNENWLHIGRNFAIIISGVTAIVIYFQFIENSVVTAERILSTLPFIIVFALTNSFVEESITRLGVVVVLKDILNDKSICLMSALIFGTVHFWGIPGGFVGLLFAGFLGWFLAKSIVETQGIFWAWFIHFLQDMIIFSALLILA